jgi:hypothetical protein
MPEIVSIKVEELDELQHSEQVNDEFTALAFALFFSYNNLNNELECED